MHQPDFDTVREAYLYAPDAIVDALSDGKRLLSILSALPSRLSEQERERVIKVITLTLLGFSPLEMADKEIETALDARNREYAKDILRLVQENIFDELYEDLIQLPINSKRPRAKTERFPRKPYSPKQALEHTNLSVSQNPPKKQAATTEFPPLAGGAQVPKKPAPRYSHDPYREEAEDWEE